MSKKINKLIEEYEDLLDNLVREIEHTHIYECKLHDMLCNLQDHLKKLYDYKEEHGEEIDDSL